MQQWCQPMSISNKHPWTNPAIVQSQFLPIFSQYDVFPHLDNPSQCPSPIFATILSICFVSVAPNSMHPRTAPATSQQTHLNSPIDCPNPISSKIQSRCCMFEASTTPTLEQPHPLFRPNIFKHSANMLCLCSFSNKPT